MVRLVSCTAALLLLLRFCSSARPEEKTPICHIPPRQPDKFHTIYVNPKTVDKRLERGDSFEGPCDDHCDILCDDGDACTIDYNAALGCETNGCGYNGDVDCDDGDLCTINDCDSVLGCTSTPVDCEDGNDCTVNDCDPISGCTTTPVDCDDPNASCVDGECQCNEGYVGSPSGCTVPAPPCDNLVVQSYFGDDNYSDESHKDGACDLCPGEIDCVIAFPFKEGASIPFSYYDDSLEWGFVLDIAKACPTLNEKPEQWEFLSLPHEEQEAMACVVDIMYGCSYDNLKVAPNVKLWLFSNGYDLHRDTSNPLAGYHGAKRIDMYSAPKDSCPLPGLQPKYPDVGFTGRNLPFGCWAETDDACPRFATGQSTYTGHSSPNIIPDGFFTLQFSLWTDYVDEPPPTCPCWTPEMIEEVNTVLHPIYDRSACAWTLNYRSKYQLSLSDRYNGVGEVPPEGSTSTSREGSYMVEEMSCTGNTNLPPVTYEWYTWLISPQQFQACYEPLVEKCEALGKPAPYPNAEN